MNYYEKEAVSQSKLKLFIDCREAYYDKFIRNNYKDTPALGFGRYYHTLMLQPELIDSKYVIDKGVKVEGLLGKFIEEMSINSDIDNAYIKAGFKITKEKVLENFNKKENQDYLNFLVNSKGKEIVSEEDFYKAQKMRTNFIGSQSGKLLFPELPSSIITTHTELEIEWFVPYVKLPLKSMLDKVIIDHNKRKITIFDIKTTSCINLKSFSYDCRKYKYYIQAAFYKSAIEYMMSTEWLDLNDYIIEFIFIPQYTKEPYHLLKPCRISEDDMNKGYLEYRQALIEIETCMLLNTWESDADRCDHNGIVTLSIFNQLNNE